MKLGPEDLDPEALFLKAGAEAVVMDTGERTLHCCLKGAAPGPALLYNLGLVTSP